MCLEKYVSNGWILNLFAAVFRETATVSADIFYNKVSSWWKLAEIWNWQFLPVVERRPGRWNRLVRIGDTWSMNPKLSYIKLSLINFSTWRPCLVCNIFVYMWGKFFGIQNHNSPNITFRGNQKEDFQFDSKHSGVVYLFLKAPVFLVPWTCKAENVFNWRIEHCAVLSFEFCPRLAFAKLISQPEFFTIDHFTSSPQLLSSLLCTLQPWIACKKFHFSKAEAHTLWVSRMGK